MFRFWMRLGAISPLVAVSLVFTLPIKSALASSYQSPLSQSIESTYAQNSPIDITNVRLSETDGEVVIVLETDGELPQPITAVSDNTLTSDISNAVLALPEGDIFSTISPTNDISQITIVNLANNQVRVEIVGNETVPSIETSVDTDGLALTVFTDSEAIDIVEADDGILRITVTGEDTEDYRVPNASTATRTDTPILDIPASIQIIPQQVLEDQQVTRLDEALANVSGVTFGGTFVGTSLNFNVRGFDAPTLRNGIRDFGGFTGVNPAITNLDRVEVLKGPASILYGEVQPGGVINLVTEQPLNEPTYEIALQAGSREFFQPEIDLSGPLASDGSLLYRLNAAYSHDDGFTDFNEDLEQIFVAPVLTWQPSDRTRLTLEAEYLDDRQPFETGLVAFGDGVIDVPFDRIISEPDNFTESELFRIGYNLEHQINDTWQLRHAFEHSDRDLFNIGVLPLEFDETTGIITRFPAQQKLITQNSSMQTNVVGEFATGTIDHTLLAGFDWNRTLDSEFTGFDFFTPSFLDIFNPVYGLADFDGNALPTFRDTNIKINRIGVYLQDQVEFSDNFFLLAGVRYDNIEQTTTNNPIPFLDPFGSETTQEDDAFTPRFGIVYKPVDFLSLYGSYSQSFTPNIGTTSAGDALAPEEGEGFEVGIKAELLEDNLFATLSYFDITRQNVATSDPLDPFASVATGEQRSQGIELDVVGELLPGWNVIASYAYTDARVTDDNDVPEGNGLVNIPENSASLWTTYEIQSGDLEGLGFGIGFNFVGERPGNLGGFEETFELDDYFLTNAGIFYRRDNWRFALNAKNLFDVDYVAASNNSRTSGIETGAPLTLVGSISVKF